MIAYKYRSGRGIKDKNGIELFERDIQLLAQDSIYIPTVAQLNDPSEAMVDDHDFIDERSLELLESQTSVEMANRVREIHQGIFERIHSSGIYSLSREFDNELLWAYYASGHCGYAVIFDTDVLAESYGSKWGGMYEFCVRYSYTVPQLDITKMDDQLETMICLLGTKSMAWEHEEEYRLVFDKGGEIHHIDRRAIKGFVFGLRMTQEDKDYIMKLFAGRDLAYYNIELVENSYVLTRNRIEDKYPDADKY